MMNLLKSLKSQFGFSMMEITLALGILGLGVFAFTDLSRNSANLGRSTESLTEKIAFLDSFRNFINSGDACKDISSSGQSFEKFPTLLTFPSFKISGIEGNPNLTFSAGRKFKNFVVEDLKAQVRETTPVILNGMNFNHSTFEVRLSLKIFNKIGAQSSPSNVESETHAFYIPILLDSNRRVYRCGSGLSAEKACMASGGSFDSTGVCKTNTNCKIVGSYTNPPTHSLQSYIPLPGVLHTNDTLATQGCLDGVAVKTGYIDFHYKPPSGKKSSVSEVTQKIDYYTCIKCPGPIGGSGGAIGGGGGGGGGGGCFVAGTQIQMFDGSKKSIEDVRVGDELVDISGGKVVAEELVGYDYKGLIYSINGGPYFFTPNHPFYSLKGWKSLDPTKSMKESPGLQVSFLELGDVLVRTDGFEVILSLDSVFSEERVYNFSVSETNQYIANDYAVHNLIPVQKK